MSADSKDPAEADERRPLLDVLREAAPPEWLAAVGRLFIGARGRVWVQRERRDPLERGSAIWGVAGGTYDVFDSSGRFLGTVRAPTQARLQAVKGDTVWGFEFGEYDEPWIVA